MRKIRYISMCSGVEAASLAWGPLGWEPVAFAEIEEFPSAVLAARFPDVPNLHDVTAVDWKEYHGAADLVVAGFPCQSYSIAGLRKGLDDPRGQIMLACLAACRDIDPEWIVLENVAGLLSSHGGRDFETLLNAVAFLWPRGGCSFRILDAQWFGVAQRRRRVFVVINTRDWRRAAEVLLERDCLLWDSKEGKPSREALAAEAGAGSSPSGGGVGNPTAFKWFAGAGARSCAAYDDGTTPTLTNSDAHQPAVMVEEPMVMASGQSNAEIGVGGVAPTVASRNYKDPPILLERQQATGATSSQPSATQTEASSSSTTSPSKEDGSSSTRDGSSPSSAIAVRTANTGANGCGISDDVAHTVDTTGPEAVFYERPKGEVYFVANDNGKAAVDVDLAGTLIVGGQSPYVAIPPTSEECRE